MEVKELWRFPVKSMGGEQIQSSLVTELGLKGDRRWGLIDNTTGMVLSAKREGRLLLATARIDGDEVVVRLPDGTETNESAPIAAWLNLDVSLVAADSECRTYEDPRDFEGETDWVQCEGAAHAWHDSKRTRVSLVSTTTLGEWDRRRFRSNIVLTGEGEDELVGHSFGLGTCRLDVLKKIDRCVMVTRAQQDIERDLTVLRSINSQRDKKLAVGTLVSVSGTISVGDAVQIDR